VVIAPVAFPGSSPESAADAILAAVTSRTRLAVIDHITSATALVFPIQRLVAELTARGVETLVDGAHAPGQVELDVPSIGATYYTANLHKWVCAPKGSGFIWVRTDHQAAIRPLSISHGANSTRTDRSRFRVEFDWTGTADPSAYLATVDAIRFGEELMPGGWAALRARNHELAVAGRDLLCAALGVDPPAPDEMVGTMASVPLPLEQRPGKVQGVELYDDPVHDHLATLGMQVMVTPWPQRPDGGPWRRLIRISAAAYNDLEQFERLAAALPGALAAAA
jgi:isopenicillin-N epimerase